MAAQGNGFTWEASMEQAKERARKEGKALLIDFTAAPL